MVLASVGAQTGIALLILLIPVAINYFSNFEIQALSVTMKMSLTWMAPFLITYFVNFYLLVPCFFYGRRRWLFYAVNFVLMTAVNVGLLMFHPTDLPLYARAGYYTYIIVIFVLNVLAAGCALGIRHFIRWSDMELKMQEQMRKNTEAELAWLKNQLNPHFLFNTLNNISGLTQIDADAAQDNIARLSDLLRYAMYETNKEFVPIAGEMEFMENYVNLMKLRCNEMTTVTTEFHVEQSIDIAPLLFISPIENAFKHGVSSNRPSFVKVMLKMEGNELVFVCYNSNYPKDDHNRSGSGIGMDNLRRRLELLYPGRYRFEYKLIRDEYHVTIRIRMEKKTKEGTEQ